MDKLSPVAFAAPAKLAPVVEGASGRKFSGIAYAGGVITDHPLFARVAFDLASTTLATPAPAHYGHDHKQPIGVIDAAEVSERIAISGTLFDDIDERSKLVAAMADRGMPWQMSVGIHPGRMDEIKVGAKAEVNGQTMAGPLTVFRNNRVREVSFCTLGADGLTSAQVFTIGATSDATAATPEPPKMSEISKEDYDRAITDLATTKASLEASNAKIAELEGKFAAQALEHRTAAVKELFSAISRDYKDADAAPYLSMDDVVFAAVSKDLRAARPALDPSLMKTHADGGVDEAAKPKTAADITNAARQHIAAQAKLGFAVTNAEAVQFVARAA